MEKRSGYAAIIGRPNVGKSTLMNAIIGMKIAITSSKPQTTRNRIKTVYTEDRGQIVFLDTPGLHKSKNRLGDFMMRAASRALKEADLILWLVEASDYIGPGDRRIAEMLEQVDAPVILVINKIDRVKKPELLGIIDAFSKLRDFNEIIPVSALKGDGRDELVDTMFSYMPQGEPFYDEDTVTDMMERDICAELVREQALRLLSDEIPHGVAVTIESMKEEPDIISVLSLDLSDEKCMAACRRLAKIVQDSVVKAYNAVENAFYDRVTDSRYSDIVGRKLVLIDDGQVDLISVVEEDRVGLIAVLGPEVVACQSHKADSVSAVDIQVESA